MTVHYYPSSLGSDNQLHASIQFSIYERESIRRSSPLDIISLYMPESMSIPSTVSWDSAALGPAGAAIHGMQAGDLAGGVKGTLGAMAMHGLRSAFTQGGNSFLKRAENRTGVQFSADNVEKAISAGSGKSINPYLTAVFEGIDFRTFRFNFKFVPHTENDCERIDSIIKTFRAASLPAGTFGGAVFDYPHEFELKYLWKGQEHDWLKKFKRSVLTRVDTQYGQGNQWSQHRNGFPTMIVLDMEFKEIQLVLRDDVANGGY